MLTGSGDYQIDDKQKRILRGAQTWRVGPRQFDLLTLLHQHRGEVLTSGTILDALYHNRDYAHPDNIHRQVHILRQLVAWDVVDTVPGYGYGVGIEL